MKLAGKTDVGRVRQENQDDYRAGELPGGAVWALVCDGMGGAKGGREASQGACNVIEQVFQEQYAQCGAGQEGAFLKKALISANRYVFNKAAHEESLAGMGTTAVCALVRGGEATLCHAGDSRAYLCRDGKLTQLTHDHSYVQELVDCGTITVEEAEHHPQKNIITRALGVDYRLEPEVTSVQLQAKDLLLLCSDGLTNMVPVEQMEQLLAQGPFYDLPDRLVDAANENGGSDNITALLLAVGIDPEQHVLFVQSHVPAHCELSWVLACNTQFGELSRMTQFKDKSAKHPDNVNGGLFTYPVLMAADILVYNADLVPVGQDQTQHLEIARTIANRFNGIYGDTFTLPAGYVPKAGAKIMSLAEPTKKMSKSDTNANAFVLMTDDKDTIVRKFKRAVTDSDGVVRFDAEDKPGVSNLMTIYSTFTGKDLAAIEAEFAGKGYGDFKLAVAEVTADALAPVQAEYGRILADKAYVDGVLKSGAERAARLANRTVSKVYRKVGLMQLDK